MDDDTFEDYIKEILNDRLKKKTNNWCEEDEKILRQSIFELNRDLRLYMEKDLSSLEDSDGLILDDDEDDYPESYDDLTIGIDKLINYDFEHSFFYNKYDYYFYLVTFFLLLFYGCIIFSTLYIAMGLHMCMQLEYDPDDDVYTSELADMDIFTSRAFNIFDCIKNADENRCYLSYEEQLKFITYIIFKDDTATKQIYPMEAPIVQNYNIFIKSYFNIYYNKNIKYIYNYNYMISAKSYIVHFNGIFIKNNYCKYVNIWENESNFIFNDIYLTEYYQNFLIKDVEFLNKLSQNKLKIKKGYLF